MAIARLMDPPQTGKFSNLSLERFVGLQLFAADHEILTEQLSEIKKLWTNIDVWRNKHLAHHDLTTKFNPSLLPPVRLDEIEVIVSKISILHQHTYKGTGMHVDLIPKELGGVPLLIDILQRGIQSRKERFKP